MIFYSIYRETHRVLVVVASMCIYILLFYSTAIKGTGKPISCNIHSRLVFNRSYSGYMYLYYINFEWRLSSSTGLWWRSDESHQEEEENPARPRARKKKKLNNVVSDGDDVKGEIARSIFIFRDGCGSCKPNSIRQVPSTYANLSQPDIDPTRRPTPIDRARWPSCYVDIESY